MMIVMLVTAVILFGGYYIGRIAELTKGGEHTSHYGELYKELRAQKIAALEAQEKSLKKMLDTLHEPAKMKTSQPVAEGRRFKEIGWTASEKL